jgi:integrase
MPRKKTRRAIAGNGSVYWSASQERYVAELNLGRDDRGIRIKKVLVGPRGDKSEDARLGLADRLQQQQRKRSAVKRGHVHSRLTLGEYLDQWIETKTNLSEKGRIDYEAAIENHIRPGLGRARLRDLDRKKVREFFANLTTVDEPKRPLGPGGAGKVYTVLRAALNDAVDEHELLLVNPAARLKIKKESKPLDKGFWTPDEQQKFLRAAKEHQAYYFPLLVTMIGGALSQAEAFALRWKDIDLRTGVTSVLGDLIEVEGRIVRRETKTEFRVRSFVIPDVALRELRERHKAIKPEPNEYVFTTPTGTPIRRTNFGSRIFKPLVKKAKVTPITPHKLRDCAGSLLIARGHNPGVVHRVLGHSDYRTTSKKYQHQLDESRDAVAATFNELFRAFE